MRGSKAVRRSALELQMMNLTGTPDTAVQVGRKASWVATREYNSRPFDGTGVFFIAEDYPCGLRCIRGGET